MYDYQVNDTVMFRFKGNKMHGIIQYIGKKNAKVWVADLCEVKTLPIECLTYIQPIVLTI